MTRPPADGASGGLPRIVQPVHEFLSAETAGGMVLLAAAAVALLWANLPSAGYADTWNANTNLDLGFVDLHLTMRDWVNDGLMAIFFFVVGLEIKRELLRGELSDRRSAVLPVVAAAGGMIIPAAIFLTINAGGHTRGWGIPMATDIAFAAGVLSLLGRRAPLSLKVFLLALAIVDDLGAIAVIAIFYTDDLSLPWVGASLGVLALIAALATARIRSMWFFLPLALAAWLAVHESGVHATVAGVLVAFLLPVDLDRDPADGAMIDQLEGALHPWSSFLVVPIFALANAGVELGGSAIADAASSRVAVGIALGLLLGKPAGILLFSAVAVRLGIASLPAGTEWSHIAGAGVVAGVGFTVSIFVSELAYTSPELIDDAKIGILAASLVAGAAGYTLLRVLSLRAGS